MKGRGLTCVCISSSQVYISCQVMMCKAGDPNTRCSRGCVNSLRRKREAESETARHFISQGPLRLRGTAESGPSPGKNLRGLHPRCRVCGPLLTGSLFPAALNLNLVFVAGCVLAALAMISALVIYKAKMSRAGYRPLPTQDSHTAQ